MKLSSATLTAFVLYALLGICPMQMTIIPPVSDGAMAMMMHETPMETGSEDDVAFAKSGSCSTCMKAFENLAAKKSEAGIAYAAPLLALAPVLPTLQFDTTVSNRISLALGARAGPSSLASLIVESIVLRT